MLQLQEKQRALQTKRNALSARLDQVETLDVAAKRAFVTEELPRLNDEIKSMDEALMIDTDLIANRERVQDELKSMQEINRSGLFVGNDPLFGGGARRDMRTLGQKFVDGKEYQAFKSAGADTKYSPIEVKFEGAEANPKEWQADALGDSVKATLTTANGFAPYIPRSNLVVPLGQIKPVIADLIPQENTTVPGGKYMEEILYTNTADIVPEGTIKPEAALRFQEVLFSMAKIAVTLPITDEQLEDVPQIRSIIDARLGLMVRQKEDRALLYNTNATGFDGFLVKPSVQALAIGGMPLMTGVLRLITQVENSPGFANVDAIVMNPLDWFSYVTYQTTIGSYVAGNPATDGAIKTMWGKTIIVTNQINQGTLLLGDFATYAQIFRRLELLIRVGWANDDFLKNMQRILAEERMVLQILRGSAFGQLTGIPAPTA